MEKPAIVLIDLSPDSTKIHEPIFLDLPSENFNIKAQNDYVLLKQGKKLNVYKFSEEDPHSTFENILKSLEQSEEISDALVLDLSLESSRYTEKNLRRLL
jgi:hypothetical protein